MRSVRRDPRSTRECHTHDAASVTGGWTGVLAGASPGMSTLEWLVAAAVATLLMGGLLEIVQPMQARSAAEGERVDIQQRLRAATERVGAVLGQAGAGPLVGRVRGPLGRWTATVLPYRLGLVASDPSAGVRFRSDAVSVLSVPPTAAQALLREPVAAGASSVRLEWPGSCPPSTPLSICGFRSGTHVLLADDAGRSEIAVVAGATADGLDLAGSGLAWSYRAGAAVVEVTVRVLSVRVDSAGVSRLYQYDGVAADFPLVDHVQIAEFMYFGDPRPPAVVASTNPSGQPDTSYGPPPPAIGQDDPDDTWPAGENCLFRETGGVHVSRLVPLGAGAGLVQLTSGELVDGPWCPDAGRVQSFDADLLRVRLVRVRLRLQAASAAFRGPSGPLFVRPGTARAADRFVPDLEIQFDVAPANLRLVS